MKNKKITISISTLIIIILSNIIILGSIWIIARLVNDKAPYQNSNKNKLGEMINAATSTQEEETALLEEKNDTLNNQLKQIELSFAGIINYDLAMQKSSELKPGLYSSSEIFEEINPYMSKTASFATMQNTILPNKLLSDLNIPSSLLNGIRNTNINNLIFTGKNILNHGLVGIKSIIDESKKHDIKAIGLNYQSSEPYPDVIEIDGFKIAVLPYVQVVSKAGKYAINEADPNKYIRIYKKDKISSDIKLAKKVADAVIITIMWNNENDSKPNEEQINIAQEIANAGADIIIGNSVISPLPAELLTAYTDEGIKRTVPVVYSLGNLLNSNRERLSRVSSIILNIKIDYDRNNNSIYNIRLDYDPLFIEKIGPKIEEKYRIVHTKYSNTETMSQEQHEIMLKAQDYLNTMYKNLPISIK